jgi:hypothetical protein
LVFISGISSLINPDTDNLSGGSIKIKVCCETLAKDAAKQIYEQLPEPLQVKEFEDEYRSDSDYEVDPRPIDHYEDHIEPEEIIDNYIVWKRPKTRDTDMVTREVPKRIRVELVKTRTPSESLDDEELMKQIRDSRRSPVSKHEISDEEQERNTINHLNICIGEALNLPLISTAFSLKQIVPSCYVKLVESNNEQDSNIFKTTFKTGVIPHSTSPKWYYRFRYPLFQQANQLMLQIWHQSDSINDLSDVLLGECIVDLTGLYYGLKEIDGWYHIENKQKDQVVAQLHVTIFPEKPITHRTDTVQKVLLLEDPWSPPGSHENVEDDVLSFDPLFHTHLHHQQQDTPEDLRKKLQEDIYQLEEITKRIINNTKLEADSEEFDQYPIEDNDVLSAADYE